MRCPYCNGILPDLTAAPSSCPHCGMNLWSKTGMLQSIMQPASTSKCPNCAALEAREKELEAEDALQRKMYAELGDRSVPESWLAREKARVAELEAAVQPLIDFYDAHNNDECPIEVPQDLDMLLDMLQAMREAFGRQGQAK